MEFPRPFYLQGYNLIFYPGTAITEKALHDGFISMKKSENDYSTIQGAQNSPVAMWGNAQISNRFYKINYSFEEKLYWNTVLSLLASNYMPGYVIDYFRKSKGPFKKIALRGFIRLYTIAAAIKHSFFKAD